MDKLRSFAGQVCGHVDCMTPVPEYLYKGIRCESCGKRILGH